ELVEYATYQAYGATESNYRPGRWGSFREPYKFTGKEEVVEVGLAEFGARDMSVGVGRWMSADPAAMHELMGGPNPYAYVHGRPLIWTDPDGRLVPVVAAIVIGAFIGGAIGGISYGLTAGSEFSLLGLGAAVGVGALTGAVGGGVGAALTPALAP